ncbi:unnamed protein product [Haemonchus placei]|uniref:Reverse transcriptase domain-containing protein n=1 Tax=Haemonchus placei TaxID=6290 RepID=A0A0N4WFJ3_HAEPC|nr:unnamed protein product [Haemonchus placei]
MEGEIDSSLHMELLQTTAWKTQYQLLLYETQLDDLLIYPELMIATKKMDEEVWTKMMAQPLLDIDEIPINTNSTQVKQEIQTHFQTIDKTFRQGQQAMEVEELVEVDDALGEEEGTDSDVMVIPQEEVRPREVEVVQKEPDRLRRQEIEEELIQRLRREYNKQFRREDLKMMIRELETPLPVIKGISTLK